MPPQTGPIPRELLEPAFYPRGMAAQDSRALLRSCEWQALTSRNNQVVFLSEFGETDTASRLTTDDIAMILNINSENVRQIQHRARVKKKESHRPLALDPDQEADIVRFIRERFGSQNYGSQRDVLNYVEERFNKILTYGWMKRFLDRHKSEVSGVTITPQEKVRLEIPHYYLEEYLTLIKKIVPIARPESLSNLDEPGLSEWENRISKSVFIPTQEQESRLHYPVDRSVRYHTLFCFVTDSGDSYCPMLIASTASARKIFDTGVRDHIEYCELDDRFQLLVDDGKIRDSPEFAEIWRIDFPLEGLSARRRVDKWRFMNRQFFKGRYLKILRQRGFDETITV
jgi:hypothetical protein